MGLQAKNPDLVITRHEIITPDHCQELNTKKHTLVWKQKKLKTHTLVWKQEQQQQQKTGLQLNNSTVRCSASWQTYL